MALQVTIAGTTQIYFGGQTVLTASVVDTETGQTPAGLQYAWTAADGSFVGATNGASVTYHADFTGNADQAVTITCEVTLPGNANPTVDAPSLTAMTEIGITDQLVNMLITAEVSGSELFDRTSSTAIDADSDTLIDTDMRVNRLRWTGSSLILNKASGGTQFRNWWNGDRRDAYSAFIIINDGTVVELLGTWIALGSGIGGNFMRWDVPSTETDIRDALDTIATEQLFLFGIADTGSIGLPAETVSADATVNVRYNAPPVVSITAPARLNPGDSTQIEASIRDPEGTPTTVRWETTAGTILNPTAPTTRITAPNTPGPITITATAADQHGVEGSMTHVIVINSPPSVVITAPSQLEVGRTGNISIAVSDPNNDTVTVLLHTSAGSIDNPTATSTIITAPVTPQTITVTCTATDAGGLQTVETAQITIVANQPPTLSITVPNALDIGQTGNLRATVGDPTNDPVTIRWDASDGVIGNQTALNTTITVPATPQTITVTCTATDDRGAMTTKTATITVRQPNRPPTVSLNVPATASPGQTVNIEATVTDLDGDDTEGEWRSPKGSIAHPENASTTFTAPPETGIVPLTYEAMDDMGATSSETAYITVGDPKRNIYTPAVRIEIEGVDVTDRRIPRDGLVVGKSLDYPELLTFRSSGISFNLDNEDGAFDYNSPNNFFISNGLPAHGRGATVLVRIGLSQSELIPVFAGEISEVVTRLGDTKARINARDLSVRSRQKVIENFGIEITRRITDFEGAALDYDAFDPVFYFPIWGLPISRNSVSITVHQGETDIPINIVEAIKTEGMLSNRNVEIDYSRGLIRFEAPPDDGIDTQITATWKRDYRYKRPDFLVRQTLKNTGVQDTLQITDDTSARFAIEQSLVRHPTDPIFSSHGRPYFQREGVARWMKHDPNENKWLFTIDNRLVEYDEYQDEYIELSEVPDDDTIDEVPPGGYGEVIDDQFIPTTFTNGIFVIDDDQIYIRSHSEKISIYDLAGNLVEADALDLSSLPRHPEDTSTLFGKQAEVIRDFKILNNQLFVLHKYQRYNVNYGFDVRTLLIYDLPLESPSPPRVEWFYLNSIDLPYSHRIAVTPDRIIIAGHSNTPVSHIQFIDHAGGRHETEDFDVEVGYRVNGLDATANFIYFLEEALSINTYDNYVRVFQHTGVELTGLRFPAQVGDNSRDDCDGLQVIGNVLYTYRTDTDQIDGISIIDDLNFHDFVPYQFDTYNFEDIYVLATNTLGGDILVDTTFNRVRVYKYDRSADTWTNILNPTTGQPQLAMPYDFIDENKILADSRKNFRVIRRSGKTLIFYRRVQSGSSGVAMDNETDGTITDVYSESFTTDNHGLPYSMDFWCDERSDGIYVYTFVVNYTFSGGDFDSATLKVYRRRMQPTGTETEIFSEDFPSTSDDDLYPVSVSDVILADDRSKFYFVLEPVLKVI